MLLQCYHSLRGVSPLYVYRAISSTNARAILSNVTLVTVTLVTVTLVTVTLVTVV